jgi:hypothetical protein
MSVPVIISISPGSGAPGTAIALVGSGFDAAARVGCPALVDTAYGDSTSLQATIPADLSGPEGGTMLVSVFVMNSDASISNQVTFTVIFPALDLQTWTSIELVCGEVPGFQRGNLTISDANIRAWMKSIAQAVAGAMLRRGLSLDPTQWQQGAAGTNFPSPVGVLEQIVRSGAAARLAGTVGSQFSASGEGALAKDLRNAYAAEMALLNAGQYDKLFKPSSATVESGQLAFGGDVATTSGNSTQAFTKQKVF